MVTKKFGVSFDAYCIFALLLQGNSQLSGCKEWNSKLHLALQFYQSALLFEITAVHIVFVHVATSS